MYSIYNKDFDIKIVKYSFISFSTHEPNGGVMRQARHRLDPPMSAYCYFTCKQLPWLYTSYCVQSNAGFKHV